ncbi:DUF3489 domain-containing protein [Xanthobacter autotrophicus]|uniref:DUF3489 domain-containing protein n=1 Tax=Xanthobacter autotrophicus TaxID=280 RepID=UPI0037266842
MSTKAQSKPSRSDTPTARKTATRRSTTRTPEASTSQVPTKRKTTEVSSVKAASAFPTEPTSGARPKPGSKLGMVLALLEKPQGASLAKLVEVTGWLPHTTRAALTGLRKRGFAVVSEKAEGGGASVYRLYGKVA